MKSFLTNRSKRINSSNNNNTKSAETKSAKNKSAQSKLQDKMNEDKENIDAATERMIGDVETCGTEADCNKFNYNN